MAREKSLGGVKIGMASEASDKATKGVFMQNAGVTFCATYYGGGGFGRARKAFAAIKAKKEIRKAARV